MSDPLLHVQANALYDRLKPSARATLAAVNDGQWEQARGAITEIKSALASARSQGDAEESYLNDLFVLDAYSDLLLAYSDLWQNVVEQRFAASWNSLQDALDLLRVIKRFSGVDVIFFEDQLTQLEGLYPYDVFASVGMVVEGFNCNICSWDIDSDDCPHLRGRLYRGVMAHGIARGIRHLNHVALTTTPADKRCVIDYPNDGEQFKLVRFLSNLLKANQCRPSDFSHLRHSTRPLPDVGDKGVGRNDPCPCGSGTKFKKCCLVGPAREQKHVDIVTVPRSFETAVI
jgi:hypothetical protein